MNEPYIKLYRKSLDSAVFASEPLWRLWSYLLMSANWAERQLPDGTVLKPGQMVRGVRRIMEDLKWCRSKVDRWLSRLKDLGNIETTQRTGPLAQVVTICHWETYQAADVDVGASTGASTGATSGASTGAEKKKSRTVEGKKHSVHPTLDEVRAYCQERQNTIDAETFVDYYTANGWVQGRAGKPIKDWKACVRTWEKNSFKTGRKHGTETAPSHTHDPKRPCEAI